MARTRSYRRKRRSSRRRRLVSNPTTSLTAFTPRNQIVRPTGSFRRPTLSHLAKANTAIAVASQALETANNWHKMAGMLKSKANFKTLKQSGLVQKGKYNKMHRHEKLKTQGNIGPVNKGKGFNTRPNGVLTTHGKGVVPKWKRKRLYDYKYDVWQTVLLSKANRMPASNNILSTYRYPIKAVECKDSETLQAMIFTPWCSNFSGIHTTLYRKINDAGTDIDHGSELLDAIQNKCDNQRHSLNGNVDAVFPIRK